MSNRTLPIAITCFASLLLFISFAVADKPELAGKPEWAEVEQVGQEAKKDVQEAGALEKEAERVLHNSEQEPKKEETAEAEQESKATAERKMRVEKAEMEANAEKTEMKTKERAEKAKRKAMKEKRQKHFWEFWK